MTFVMFFYSTNKSYQTACSFKMFLASHTIRIKEQLPLTTMKLTCCIVRSFIDIAHSKMLFVMLANVCTNFYSIAALLFSTQRKAVTVLYSP